MTKMQIELTNVIENYFGADAGYLDISCLDLARRIMEAGWNKTEVVHGRWRGETEEEQPHIVLRRVVCSVCGGKTNGRYNYCPHCAAKMDLED